MKNSLHNWFQKNKRSFPWRENRTPYRVWISEIMLQQTRASVVIPYFLRWMERFPDVRALGEASLEEVIKTWEGLGYYSRARNLHRAAGQLIEQFGGEIVPEALEEMRGIGPYTRGAILSFGFRQKAAAVDGNVLRVMSRLFCIEMDISKTSVRGEIERKVEELLDEKEPWVTAEAFIELGATVCLPKPLCAECPLQQECFAFRQKKTEALPIRNKETKITPLHRIVAIVISNGCVLVKKQEAGRVMADLYEFPYLEIENKRWGFATVQKKIREFFPFHLQLEKALSPVHHTFTRFKAHLYPHLFSIEESREFLPYEWVPLTQLSTLPFSSGHRKIVQELLS